MSTVSEGTPSTLELAEAVAGFAAGFDRWARSVVVDDAPSVPRLRLLYTLHCNGPQRMADLAEALEVTPRSVTALVDGLETEGLVRRTPHPTDRRATIVELEAGAIDVEDQYRKHAEALAGLFEDLDPKDRRRLMRMIRSLDAKLGRGRSVGEPAKR
jgi:DNA-binding MarR family transcriptional regulator